MTTYTAKRKLKSGFLAGLGLLQCALCHHTRLLLACLALWVSRHTEKFGSRSWQAPGRGALCTSRVADILVLCHCATCRCVQRHVGSGCWIWAEKPELPPSTPKSMPQCCRRSARDFRAMPLKGNRAFGFQAKCWQCWWLGVSSKGADAPGTGAPPARCGRVVRPVS